MTNDSRREFLDAIDSLVANMFETLEEAQRAGKITAGGRVGVLVDSMMRGVSRIQDLPDERELTEAEIAVMQASLIQVSVASLALLEELPFPAIDIVVAGFDTSNPQ